ncbi:hypothetical protein CDL15_Pgr016342 [Punica granatum]|uniref:MATH domain-containing protein n=1 Tax=Punica granatum TaxID=22663 RepID=A0A218W7R4_PUNGR|nr:hypothetical protein CDL15_Pgr016342 [Punica granatum]
MAGVVLEEPGVGRSDEGSSSMPSSHSGEALAEWRSSEQVENGTQLTTAPYWDTDNDDDGGPKPSELYGKYTWKIEKFSEITKRELRSSAFEVGGYKWYILIYPQGCDVCNHLSLFLCVANHDKLLPGWSHFAQFTIAVVNKDPKKSKYSDTLHRFWKKEHDWGWKKFMELSKMSEGFVEEDTLIIKAQVQVIREKADRPFRCLDSQYRRELVRVYLTNVEQICRRFVEERRGKLGKLIEDKARWTSFCAFWMDIDPDSRRSMSRENTDVILKVVVKHFFIEKEVTSTLVMDSLYSGLKALESQSKCKKGRAKKSDTDDMPAPIVRVEQDTFFLVDDVLPLLERAAIEPLPPKDEKGPQNRTKHHLRFLKLALASSLIRFDQLHTINRFDWLDEVELVSGNKIEVAYQEAVALKRQEELIREEEAAWQAESEQKAKRGANAKEKKSKKKASKQKSKNRKAKDKERMDRPVVSAQDKTQQRENLDQDEKEELTFQGIQPENEKSDMLEDASDVSDLVDCVGESLQPDSEERDASPINWDTDTSEVHPPTEASSSGVCSLSPAQNGIMNDKRSPSVMDDSSSTCSSDSVPSVVTSGSYKGNPFPNYKNQKSPSRGKSQRSKATSEVSSRVNQGDSNPGPATADVAEPCDAPTSKATDVELEAVASPLQPHASQLENHNVTRDETSSQKRPSSEDQIDEEKASKVKSVTGQSSSSGSLEDSTSTSSNQLKSDHKNSSTPDPASARKAPATSIAQQNDKATTSSQVVSGLKPDVQRTSTPKPPEKSTSSQVPVMPRPSSAPLVPGVKPPAPAISIVQSTPLLARSVSAVGRLGPDPASAAPSYVPQSYRNAIIGNSLPSSSSAYSHPSSPSAGAKSSGAFSQGPNLVSSSPMFLPPSERMGFPFGAMGRDVIPNGLQPQWVENHNPDNNMRNLEYYRSNEHSGSQEQFSDLQAGPSGRHAQGLLSDDFPHLDIINDLLDEEQGIGKFSRTNPVFPHSLNRQFSFPGEVGVLGDMEASASSASCRFERTRSYRENGFQRSYSSFPGGFDSVREYNMPQVSPMPYANGQMDGMIPSQWSIAGSDLSMLGMKSLEGEGYPYYSPEYSNLACGVNGYNVFRPPSGP